MNLLDLVVNALSDSAKSSWAFAQSMVLPYMRLDANRSSAHLTILLMR